METSQFVPPPEVVVTIPFLLKPLFKNEEFLQLKYSEEGLSLARIAEEIGASKEAVRRGLRHFGIVARTNVQRRSIHPPHKDNATRGKLRLYEQEQRTISRVLELRAQQLSLRDVAEILSSEGATTKANGRRWHPQMIARILNSPRRDAQ